MVRISLYQHIPLLLLLLLSCILLALEILWAREIRSYLVLEVAAVLSGIPISVICQLILSVFFFHLFFYIFKVCRFHVRALNSSFHGELGDLVTLVSSHTQETNHSTSLSHVSETGENTHRITIILLVESERVGGLNIRSYRKEKEQTAQKMKVGCCSAVIQMVQHKLLFVSSRL